MPPTDRESLERALEALEWNLPVIEDYGDHEQLNRQHRAIIALRERLAQPEQEPVANIRTWHKNGEQHAELWNWDKGIETLPDGNYDLYTAPPQRKPLTDDEIEEVFFDMGQFAKIDLKAFARAIEAAHGIKGEA